MPEPTPKYHVEETTKTIYRKEHTVYTVVRADGTPAGRGEGQDPRILNATYDDHETAAIVAQFYSRTPAGYRLTREMPLRAAQRPYWRVTGKTDGDPSSIRLDWEDGAQVPAAWPAGTTWLDVLVRKAHEHADSAPARIARKADRDASAAAPQAIPGYNAALAANAQDDDEEELGYPDCFPSCLHCGDPIGREHRKDGYCGGTECLNRDIAGEN
ncbi:hypothetical protein ACIQIG_32850 [Streptomyces bacillaris]|uniref:hypothetical protein n=1 Tax=Streptomyces bacillaris TaxID=68179 RepID=UPI00345FF64C